MAAQRSMWSKLGKYVSAIVIVCFFLPFFGVSCDGMDVITISGADMVGGCKPGGLIASAQEDGNMQGGKLETKVEDVAIEPFAIAALALVVLLFGLSFVRSKSALRATLAVAVLAIGMLVALYLKIGSDLREAVEKESQSIKQGRMTSDVEVEAGGRFGLWLAGIGLLSVIGMSASAMLKKPTATPEVGSPPQPTA